MVCANDRLAVGAIAALRRHGLDCPDDVSVTGYNDMPLADRLSPALTTVRVQHYKGGLESAELIVDADARQRARAAAYRAAGRDRGARLDRRAYARRAAGEAAAASAIGAEREDTLASRIYRSRRHGRADRPAPDGGGTQRHRLEPLARQGEAADRRRAWHGPIRRARSREASEIVFSIVTDGAAVRAVALGDDGVSRGPASRAASMPT